MFFALVETTKSTTFFNKAQPFSNKTTQCGPIISKRQRGATDRFDRTVLA